jgi:DNA-binding transcriptional LysR family regulator
MDLRHLRAVLAVAEQGTFTGAATVLYMAQSTLSRQVSALEHHLGTELFIRGPRAVSLTDHGRLFLPYAQHLLDHVGEAERAIKAS